MNLKTLNTLLIDGDGVLWYTDTPLPGLNQLFDALAARGINWALITNNSTRTKASYLAKLRGFGVHVEPHQVYSSATVTATTLQAQFDPGAQLYVVGETGLIETLEEAGFNVTDGDSRPDHADAVIVGFDRQFTYRKLGIAMNLINAGAAFIATNPDTSITTVQGIWPGAGALIAAIEAATEQKPLVIGKPEAAIYHTAMQVLGASPETTAVLGDRLETDILGGQRVGIGTIAVLSGISTREDIETSGIKPDLIFESIVELAEALEQA